jgi:uncharacterized membrane protein
MTDNPTTDLAATSRRWARRLRIAAVVVLVLGIVGGSLVYWLGTRADDLSQDPSMIGYDRGENQQVDVIIGKPGELFVGWMNDLKQPGTQAVIIIAVAVLTALICFKCARLHDRDADWASQN